VTPLLIGSILAILRAADGDGKIKRAVMVSIAALILTIYITPIWWMFPVQAFGVAAIFWGGWSNLLDWAQENPLSDPEEHRVAYWSWKWLGKHDVVWVVVRYGFNLIPLLLANIGWFALAWPVIGLIMVACYRLSYLIKPDALFVRRAEYASWYLLGIILVGFS